MKMHRIQKLILGAVTFFLLFGQIYREQKRTEVQSPLGLGGNIHFGQFFLGEFISNKPVFTIQSIIIDH